MQGQNVQMLTELRWNIYIQRKRIAFPIFRKLRKLHIKLLEYRKSKLRKKSLEQLQSQDILCKTFFFFSLLSHFWVKIHFFFFFFFYNLSFYRLKQLDLDTIMSFRNPILHVREIICLNECSRKNVWLWNWLKQEFLCK